MINSKKKYYLLKCMYQINEILNNIIILMINSFYIKFNDFFDFFVIILN